MKEKKGTDKSLKTAKKDKVTREHYDYHGPRGALYCHLSHIIQY